MDFLLALFAFLIWRVFDFLIIFFSQKVIPYLGFFPYQDQLASFHLPTWVSSLANFDGLHYVFIARQGYAQYEQAFFPLYSLFIRLISPLFHHNELFSGLIISNLAFLLGIWLFIKYLRIDNWKIKKWPLFFLLGFPTSFFFGSVYTEGLFFLFFIGTLYFLKKENYLMVATFSFLASLTRLIGIFLLIPILFHLFSLQVKDKNLNKKERLMAAINGTIHDDIVYLLLLLFPVIGLTVYCFYLFKTTGDPFFFLTSQPLFGANRSSHIILLPQVYWRYFKIMIIANHDFRYFISMIEASFFSLVFVILIADFVKNYKLKIINFDRLGLNIFSLISLLLPTLTGTFSSIPRYVLLTLSFFIFISEVKNKFIRILVLGAFVILHIVLLGYFAQGYFIS